MGQADRNGTSGLAAAVAIVAIGAIACGSGDGGGHDDSGPDTFVADGSDVAEDGDGSGGGDTTVDPRSLPVGPSLTVIAEDPLSGSDVFGCDVYLDERCEEGSRRRCEVYDPAAGSFVDAPDALFERVLLYERWFDLYMSPDGQTAERRFNRTMEPDAPESVWSDPANLAHFDGWGDAALWNGSAATAAIFRYATTGTEADYARMEEKIRTIVRAYELTGVPGYLARNHFLLYPDGGPTSTDHLVFHGRSLLEHAHMNRIEDAASVEGLPDIYVDGLPDEIGSLVQGVPMWGGHVSIDSNTGAMVPLPVAWPLLRDEELKDRIAWHMTCYLKRLRRIEIINLQQNREAMASLRAALGSGNLDLDPGDPDPDALDSIVMFAHLGINQANRETFDRTCPTEIDSVPVQVIDATADDFILQMLELARDLDGDGSLAPRERPIDHFYLPTLRGGDASHLLHLATVAWMFTGEEQYREFLFDELIGRLNAVAVAHTMQAFQLPDFCDRFFGDHITYGTHWQLTTMLRDSPLRDEMVRVMEEEEWEKRLSGHMSAKFNVLYASSVPEGIGTGRERAIEEIRAQLAVLHGNGGTVNAPRRHISRDRQAIIDALPDGLTLRCPTPEERAICEDGGDLFGIPLEDNPISYPCDGRATECVMDDGLCIEGIASGPLPADLRRYADYMWQRSPYQIGETVPNDGRLQSPGLDLTEPYWIARYYGFIDDGAGQVLGWRDVGACDP